MQSPDLLEIVCAHGCIRLLTYRFTTVVHGRSIFISWHCACKTFHAAPHTKSGKYILSWIWSRRRCYEHLPVSVDAEYPDRCRWQSFYVYFLSGRYFCSECWFRWQYFRQRHKQTNTYITIKFLITLRCNQFYRVGIWLCENINIYTLFAGIHFDRCRLWRV